jgi:hypothetical protein
MKPGASMAYLVWPLNTAKGGGFFSDSSVRSPRRGHRNVGDARGLFNLFKALVCAAHGDRLGASAQELGFGCGMTAWRRLRGLAASWRVGEAARTPGRRVARGRPGRVVARGRRLELLASEKGGSKTSPRPVDRGRAGSKHHLLVDGGGLPLARTLTAANRNDVTQLLERDAQERGDPDHLVERGAADAAELPRLRSCQGLRRQSCPTVARVAGGAMLAIDGGGVCRRVRLGFRNVGETIFRMPAIEARIEGQAPSAALFSAAAKAAMSVVDPSSDLHADESYRRDLVKVLTERVLATAVARARH